MIRRRAPAAGILAPIGCHSFRATEIIACLLNGGTLENAQPWPGTRAHARRSSTITHGNGSPRTKLSGFSCRQQTTFSDQQAETQLRRLDVEPLLWQACARHRCRQDVRLQLAQAFLGEGKYVADRSGSRSSAGVVLQILEGNEYRTAALRVGSCFTLVSSTARRADLHVSQTIGRDNTHDRSATKRSRECKPGGLRQHAPAAFVGHSPLSSR